MRSIFGVALIATLLGATGYFYQLGSSVCAVPISYRIGSIDEQFAVSPEAVRAAAAVAEEPWESLIDRELFLYDENASLAIDLVFDERHERFLAESEFQNSLDAVAGMSDAVRAEYEALRATFEADRATYEADQSTYQRDLSVYNDTVAEYNDNGGAPPAELAALEETRQTLERTRQALNAAASDLNQQVEALNALQSEGNEIIADYNEGVETYNATFGEPREFTQGVFRSDGLISVYTFASSEELSLVLAHEFGHALGIDHVEGETSLMYPMLGAQSSALAPTEYDQQAFASVCAERSVWDTIQTGLGMVYHSHDY